MLVRDVKPKQTIFYQGEVPSSVGVIKSGLVRALNISENGEERTIGLFGPGDFFPVCYAFDTSPVALFFYESVIDSAIELHDKQEFKKQILANGDQMAYIARQYVGSLLHINALGRPAARNRIIHILQYLCIRFGTNLTGDVFIKISIPLTQLDIARIASLTRETTALELNTLKKEGVIEVKKKLYTVHKKKLQKVAQNDDFESLSL